MGEPHFAPWNEEPDETWSRAAADSRARAGTPPAPRSPVQTPARAESGLTPRKSTRKPSVRVAEESTERPKSVEPASSSARGPPGAAGAAPKTEAAMPQAPPHPASPDRPTSTPPEPPRPSREPPTLTPNRGFAYSMSPASLPQPRSLRISGYPDGERPPSPSPVGSPSLSPSASPRGEAAGPRSGPLARLDVTHLLRGPRSMHLSTPSLAPAVPPLAPELEGMNGKAPHLGSLKGHMQRSPARGEAGEGRRAGTPEGLRGRTMDRATRKLTYGAPPPPPPPGPTRPAFAAAPALPAGLDFGGIDVFDLQLATKPEPELASPPSARGWSPSPGSPHNDTTLPEYVLDQLSLASMTNASADHAREAQGDGSPRRKSRSEIPAALSIAGWLDRIDQLDSSPRGSPRRSPEGYPRPAPDLPQHDSSPYITKLRKAPPNRLHNLQDTHELINKLESVYKEETRVKKRELRRRSHESGGLHPSAGAAAKTIAGAEEARQEAARQSSRSTSPCSMRSGFSSHRRHQGPLINRNATDSYIPFGASPRHRRSPVGALHPGGGAPPGKRGAGTHRDTSRHRLLEQPSAAAPPGPLPYDSLDFTHHGRDNGARADVGRRVRALPAVPMSASNGDIYMLPLQPLQAAIRTGARAREKSEVVVIERELVWESSASEEEHMA